MNSAKPQIEIVCEIKSELGESPVWDSIKQRIIWVDIVNGNIHEFFPSTQKSNSFNVGQMVGAVALTASGKLVAALKNGFAKIDMEKKTVEQINDSENHLPDNRFNDGKCDVAGRFWAGTMSSNGSSWQGKLYSLEKNKVIKKLSDVSCSNGLAWSLNNKTLYFIDTPTRNVFAFDYDVTSGNINNGKIIITIAKQDGKPDGMTIDNEGMLWIALWNGWKLQRWNPHRSQLLDEIKLPVAKVTSCTFGGANFNDLYVTTASKDLTQEEKIKQPLAGRLLVLKDIGYKGFAAFTFNDV